MTREVRLHFAGVLTVPVEAEPGVTDDELIRRVIMSSPDSAWAEAASIEATEVSAAATEEQTR